MRISVTFLDAFRLYCDEKQAWMTEDLLIAQIKGTAPMSEAARIGVAFHRCLEHNLHESDGIKFDPSLIQRVLARDAGHPTVAEIKLEKDLTIDSKDITIVGKVDSGRGLIGREIKTTQKYIDIERYYEALQWRYYLWMGKFDRMDYSIFHLEESKHGWTEKAEVNVTFWPYHNLEADCIRWLREFLTWTDGKDLGRVA